MNNQKDTQRTPINTYRQDNVFYNKSLQNISIDDFINKKTEKLVTALYMVTDCMETEDAIKSKLRLLGVDLLSHMYKLSVLSPIEKSDHIRISLSRISELLSFIEIAYTIGFISEMNTNILRKEFELLASNLSSRQEKDKHFSFTLNNKMFEVESVDKYLNTKNSSLANRSYNLKDIKDKRTNINTMSFNNEGSPFMSNTNYKQSKHSYSLSDREDRIKKILGIINDLSVQADKGLSSENKDGVSIKDISLAFPDYSEKTIQRELNTLVAKGNLTKTGSKRWSRYKPAVNS